MAGCMIEKCMSTLMVGVNCYVKQRRFFKSLGLTVNDGWGKAGFCLGETYHNVSNVTLDVPSVYYSGMRLFAIIRDPIERFLSAFYNKCIL
ncbi:hypothetical protein WR25_16273 [Diploscapter pachys]|uniref:Sulfotransferase domain-containing protein n=1 Tax=Diploscapter pachys TaxID=2018661 RepID=A0A2A2L8H6_9BILA|nr:hypothetical protein WR25_16273 [Diploscapter pachys]